MAPLIDIVFLLLIFFLVATTFFEAEKDITIRLAEASEGSDRSRSPDIVVININESGVIVVNQRVMSIDDLSDHLAKTKSNFPTVAAVIRCDKRARHADFVKVLDLCERSSINQVAVATFQTDE